MLRFIWLAETPYLNVSRHMGKIIAGCIILIVIVFVIQKVRGKK